jgi:8-oxo-dGTP pyrophosphatase MutT (NUDIX family)
MHLIHGGRVGRTARLGVGCSAAIFDERREKVLLTRRADNGQWCLPGGMMEAGEGLAEACAREVWEETGLRVQVGRLIGVYNSPNRITEYADGNRYQFVGFTFEARPAGGQIGASSEVTEYGYFTAEEIAAMDVLPPHRQRIADAYANQEIAFVRDEPGADA